MRNMIQNIKAQLAAREEGQGVVEYTLVLGVLVVLIFAAFQTTGIVTEIEGALDTLITKFTIA